VKKIKYYVVYKGYNYEILHRKYNSNLKNLSKIAPTLQTKHTQKDSKYFENFTMHGKYLDI